MPRCTRQLRYWVTVLSLSPILSRPLHGRADPRAARSPASPGPEALPAPAARRRDLGDRTAWLPRRSEHQVLARGRSHRLFAGATPPNSPPSGRRRTRASKDRNSWNPTLARSRLVVGDTSTHRSCIWRPSASPHERQRSSPPSRRAQGSRAATGLTHKLATASGSPGGVIIAPSCWSGALYDRRRDQARELLEAAARGPPSGSSAGRRPESQALGNFPRPTPTSGLHAAFAPPPVERVLYGDAGTRYPSLSQVPSRSGGRSEQNGRNEGAVGLARQMGHMGSFLLEPIVCAFLDEIRAADAELLGQL